MADEVVRVPIEADVDIVAARQAGRALADRLGFTATDATLIATAISEVARNIVSYADRGDIELRVLEDSGRRGLEVTARDSGPGIRDVERAMRDGYSSGRGMGIGLPGARRLMDEFRIAAPLGTGTTVTMRKWMVRRGV